jgi:hypothetical protein
MKFFLATVLIGCLTISLYGQEVPSVYRNIFYDSGAYKVQLKDRVAIEINNPTRYGLSRMQGSPRGTSDGISFDFGDHFAGRLYFGLVPYGDSKHPMPVYFRQYVPIINGKSEVRVAVVLRGTYDMTGWEESGRGVLGYRVLDSLGRMIYDGLVGFKGRGPFEIDVTIIEGPFVNKVHEHGATISFTTNLPCKAAIEAGPVQFKESKRVKVHELTLSGLEPDTTYNYKLTYGDNEVTYAFKTTPRKGTRKPFVFAYASDSRSGQGGGERSVYGANAYIMKKIMALAKFKDAAFMQFSGDLIDGYLTNREDMNLQYANWKRAIQPFAHYFPVYVSMGNHESFVRMFLDTISGATYMVDRFPFETESGETLFAENFVNPENGPASEDGAEYDPNRKKTDFPTYRENVFYYSHDNVAVIVLNSDYFYAPTSNRILVTGGGLHGYIMDQQLEWLRKTVNRLDQDDHIDHIFITQHTPCFPNGGHTKDDMWYSGNNQWRSFVGKKPLTKGIIERRDQILEIIVNRSRKVRAVLTGDEHNYNRLKLTPETEIYPENYLFPKIELNRTIYQINNGAAGAPYYAQEETPWTPFVSNFTTQNALVFFHVDGKNIWVEVLNPDTLETVDQYWLTDEKNRN